MFVVKLYGFCLSIASIARRRHPYIESLPYSTTLWLTKYLRIYRRRRSRRRRLLATKLGTLIQLKVVYMKVSGRTSSLLQYSCKMPKIINIGQRLDVTHATEATPTSSPSSRKFWHSLTVSNPSSHVRLFCFLLCFNTNSSHAHSHHYRVQRSLELEALNR